jgi:cytochrome c-type biogenesis protein
MFADLSIYAGVMFAGLISFLSPCVLPLVPPYLAYLGGTTIERMSDDEGLDDAAWRRIVLAALCFVLGFSTVFIALGAGASVLGQLVQTYKAELSFVAGLVIIVFGLHFLGLVRINALYREVRYHGDMSGASYAGSYLIGLAFAFGWTPCVGPILAAVLTLAANENSLGAGVGLLTLYSIGLGVPFLAAAIAIRPFLGFMRRFRPYMGRIEKVMGAFLIITGVMFLTGTINWFGAWLLNNVPGLASFEEWATPEKLRGAILKKGGS